MVGVSSRVLAALARTILAERPEHYLAHDDEWAEEIKTRAARFDIDYDSEIVGRAQRAAEARWRRL